jgi:hypothetical protein
VIDLISDMFHIPQGQFLLRKNSWPPIINGAEEIDFKYEQVLVKIEISIFAILL